MSMDLYEEIGLKIRKIRQAKGMSQDALGKRIGYAGSYVSYLEAGKRTINLQILQDIADVFDVDVKTFFVDGMTEVELSDKQKVWLSYQKELEDEGITKEQIEEWVQIAKSYNKK